MNMETRIRGIGMTSKRTRARLVARLRDRGIHNEKVLAAIADVPRHMFVDEALASHAYDDCALPIGEGQTISQPYIVALMTELLLARGRLPSKVLEIGTGSGYQAAVLAALIPQVYTQERIRTLAHRAGDRFRSMGVRNISTRYADGFNGWANEAPFDAVLVTAAMPEVPPSLLEQVADGGLLIGPVGPARGRQVLTRMRCDTGAAPVIEQVAEVRFVPFLSGLC